MPKKPRKGKKKAAGKVAPNVKKYVKTQLKKEIEDKYNNFSYSSTVSNTAGAAGPAYYTGISDNIIQGLGDANNRVGDKVNITSLEMRGFTYLATNATGGNDRIVFRMIVFQVHVPVATLNNAGNALNAIYPLSTILTPGVSGVEDCTSIYNHDQKKNYTILYDKMWTQCNSNNTATSPPSNIIKAHHIRVPLRKARKQVAWIGGSTTNATDHIFLTILTQNSSATANLPSAQFSIRMHFRDA